MTETTDLLRTLQETATKLMLALPEHKLKVLIAGLLSEEGIIPIDRRESQEASPEEARQRLKSRKPASRSKMAPIPQALAIIGRGTPEQILAAIQDKLQEPVPPNHGEAVRWITAAISKNVRRYRKWPDGSWSKVKWRQEAPELASSAA